MDRYAKNILSFNKQLTTEGLSGFNLEKLRNKKFGGLIIVGMGGSGLAGEILRGVSGEIGLNPPVIVWKSYGLPKHDLKNPLYIFVSFSGDTEETISGLKAIKLKANIALVAAGGELAEIGRRSGLPSVAFDPGNLTPRQATGKMFYGIVKILNSAGFNLKVKNFTGLQPKNFELTGKKLARKLKNKLILVYSDESHKHLGYIWKIKLNETSKTPAFNNVLPEMDHNEIVGFENSRFPAAALFLVDKKINSRLLKKIKLTEVLLKGNGVSPIELNLIGKSELEETWRNIILADWTSYYLAKLNRLDPTETKIIDTLKALMKKR